MTSREYRKNRIMIYNRIRELQTERERKNYDSIKNEISTLAKLYKQFAEELLIRAQSWFDGNAPYVIRPVKGGY